MHVFYITLTVAFHAGVCLVHCLSCRHCHVLYKRTQLEFISSRRSFGLTNSRNKRTSHFIGSPAREPEKGRHSFPSSFFFFLSFVPLFLYCLVFQRTRLERPGREWFQAAQCDRSICAGAAVRFISRAEWTLPHFLRLPSPPLSPALSLSLCISFSLSLSISLAYFYFFFLFRLWL